MYRRYLVAASANSVTVWLFQTAIAWLILSQTGSAAAVGILPGVTRKVVLELAKVQERTVRLKELWKADEAFLTNALIEILPIGKPGPIGKQIAEAYRELTRTLG